MTSIDEIASLADGLASLGLSTDAQKRYPVHRTKRTAQREHIPAKDRKYVYERDGFRCVRCNSDTNLTLDHIKPWSALGSDHVDNLRTLCWPCNEARSNFQGIDDDWKPLPLTFACINCDGAEELGLTLDHPSMCPCFCWWCRMPGLGSRSEWFPENNAFWDYDLNWHRELPAGWTRKDWEARYA